MDKIEFHTSRIDDSGRKVVRILINGDDVIRLLREYEMPLAKAEGSELIAGGYTGLPAKLSLGLRKHFSGETQNRMYFNDDKTQLLQCECGEPGCWPLLCRITISDSAVTWSDFEQPHRNGKLGSRLWSYDDFGPFSFQRDAYESALDELESQVD